MAYFKDMFRVSTRPLVLGMSLLAGALASPLQAKDMVHTCVADPGAQETATFVFHPKLFGVAGNEGDGDVFTDDFEHQFTYSVSITEYDPERPDWTGPKVCGAFSGRLYT